MQYEKIVSTITESTSEDWLYTSGMGRLLNKKEIRISLVKMDDKDLKLPALDDRLRNAYEGKTGECVTYRLYYDDIMVEPLRFIQLGDNNIYVACPYYYSLSRFGGVMVTALEQAIGLALNPSLSKADYLGFLEQNHMYVDDAARNSKMKEWMK